ncbi:unnamed protein product [Phytophthora fragariaefolia]|uniref:Unnamed protein product n=1 Tax=Phytophthora fragariaefolia TaxID=1490495 RepID=A0A9W6U8Y3_9STRA|nr:unnamed protein product [Phytophthora fragariaefolia]
MTTHKNPPLDLVLLQPQIGEHFTLQSFIEMGAMLVLWGAKLLGIWKGVQVSYHGGKYSIQRLLALDAYTKNTSLLSAFLLCIGTPFPMAVVVILQELVPLQRPEDGWRANYGFWIRTTIMAFIVNFTNVGQAPYFISDLTISKLQLALVAGCTSIMFTACAIPIVSHFMFPVPFFVLVFGPMYYVQQIIVFRLVMGARIFHRMLARRDQLVRYMAFVTIQFSLLFLYPAYETLFRITRGTQYQLPVILLLPVIKVFAKNMVLRCTIHVEDMTPEAAIFTVDYFNAIYVATCMQSSSSAAAIAAISFADLSQAIFMIYGLHRHTRTILSRFGQLAQRTSRSNSLLAITSMMCSDPPKFGNQFSQSIRIRSSFPHSLCMDDELLLNKLDSALEATRAGAKCQPCLDDTIVERNSQCLGNFADTQKYRAWYTRKPNDTVYPISSNLIGPVLSTRNKKVLQAALEVLFTVECLVVASYLEAVVPVLYSGYMLTMVHFPSATYHSEMTGITRENVGATVLPVFVFGCLQFYRLLCLQQ